MRFVGGRQCLASIADGTAQRFRIAHRLTELLCQGDKQRSLAQVPTPVLNLMEQDVGEGEVLEHRDNIGERLVKGVHIRVGAFLKARDATRRAAHAWSRVRRCRATGR